MFKNSRSFVFLIFILAALLRIVFIHQISSSDISELLSLDSRFYMDLARGMLSGSPLSKSPLTFNPFYPLFLYVLFRVFGSSLLVVRIAQAIVGMVNLYLVYVISLKLLAGGVNQCRNVVSDGGMKGDSEPGTSARAGGEKGCRYGELGALTALAAAVLYQNLMFYEGAVLATTMVVFFLLSVLYISIRIEEMFSADGMKEKFPARRVLFLASVSGLLVGVASTARPNVFMLLSVVLPVWYLFRFRKRAVTPAVSFVIPFLLVIAVPVGYNYSKGAGLVPVTAHGGINFYIGNGPEANGLFNPPAGMRTDMRGLIEDAKAFSERALGKKLTQSEVSAYWTARTFDYIKRNPLKWLSLMLRKLYFFFNGTEVPDVIDRSLYIASCPVLKVCFLPFSIISALALPGLVLLLLRWRDNALFLSFIMVSIFSVVIFYVNSRYRLPSVPLLIISGSYFIVSFVERVVERRYAFSMILFSTFLGSFFLISVKSPIEVNRSALYTFLGNFYMHRNEEEKAFNAFETAYELAPGAIETRINYARLLKRKNRLEEAERLYSQAFKQRPDFPNLAIEYGALLEMMGKRKEARDKYLYAYNSGGRREKVFACKLLSRLSYVSGSRDEAIEWIRRALKLAPHDGELIRTLNRLEER